MMVAAVGVEEMAAVLAPGIALLIGVVSLIVNGERTERQRRRELYARGLAATIAYAEMPFAIRRRQHELEHRSAERVRLGTRFSEIQAEIAVCEVLIAAEGHREIAVSYVALVKATRELAGAAARTAWDEEPIQSDAEASMPTLAKELSPLKAYREQFVQATRLGTRSRLQRHPVG